MGCHLLQGDIECRRFLGWENPERRAWRSHFVFLPGRKIGGATDIRVKRKSRPGATTLWEIKRGREQEVPMESASEIVGND